MGKKYFVWFESNWNRYYLCNANVQWLFNQFVFENVNRCLYTWQYS